MKYIKINGLGKVSDLLAAEREGYLPVSDDMAQRIASTRVVVTPQTPELLPEEYYIVSQGKPKKVKRSKTPAPVTPQFREPVYAIESEADVLEDVRDQVSKMLAERTVSLFLSQGVNIVYEVPSEEVREAVEEALETDYEYLESLTDAPTLKQAGEVGEKFSKVERKKLKRRKRRKAVKEQPVKEQPKQEAPKAEEPKEAPVDKTPPGQAKKETKATKNK